MAFVFRGDEVDEDTKTRATQRLYTLLPNHKCPQRDCPFHPPPEEETKEEDDLPTEFLIRPSKSSVPAKDEGYPAEMTMEMGEEMMLSDHDSVITGDSGVGREREDFSDGEMMPRPVSPEPTPPDPQLQYIEEDDEVMTVTSETSTLRESSELDSEDERATPVLRSPPELEDEPEIRRHRDLPVYTPPVLPVPEPTPHTDFKLQAAPEFTAKLKNKRVAEGLSLHLHCSVTGLPEPQVRWLKDGLEIRPGSGFAIKNNYGLLTLEVASVGRQHGGVYSCQAFNQHGTICCEATITIEGEEEVKTIQVEILRPRILRGLEDLAVEEGQDVAMYCVATGKPMPNLKWQKDMLELKTSTRVSVTSDREGGSMLTIRRVKASDAGLYLVQAKSRSGRCQSTATLRVRGGSGRAASPSTPLVPQTSYCFSTPYTPKIKHDAPPSFSLLLPPTVDVHEGESVRLDCSVQGYPAPIVSWYKNHRGLMYGPRHRILFVGSLHTLHIPQTMALDGGDYIVKAHNNWGSAESVCTLRLLPPRESSDGTSPAKSPPDPATQPIRTGEEGGDKPKAPFFTKALPSTVEVSEGGNFRLDCVLRGGIQLVSWPQDKVTGQRPASAPDDDTGQPPQPSLQASNEADPSTQDGQPSKEATEEKLQSGSPKQFQQPLPEETEVKVGESVTLTCIVSQPFTRIRWFKDDTRLSFDTDRVESLREEGGRVLLRVAEVCPSDAGHYRCEATLSDGTHLHSATRLTVLEQDESQQKSDTRQTTSPPKMATSAGTENTPDLLPQHQRQVVGQGQRAKFKVTVEGATASTVTWSREGKGLKEGSKYKMYQEGGGHCLEVEGVSEEDRGLYTATVTTDQGAESTTSILLDIQEKAAEEDNKNKKPPPSPTSTQPPPKAPTLLTPLHDMDVVIGDRDVKLKCEVDVSGGPANSSCNVRWFQEGREVDDGDNVYRRGWNGRQASLVIQQVTPQNAGLFQCVVTTAGGGEVTTSCTLSVREPEKLEPPFFIKELHDLEVEDGDKVELVVEVEDTDLASATHHHS